MILKKYTPCLIVFIIACRPAEIPDLKNRAEEAIENGRYSTALEYLDQAITLEPDDQELHYFRGQALRSLLYEDGAHIYNVNLPLAEKASAAFERVIRINPKYDGKLYVVDPYTKIQGIWGSVATTYTLKNKPDSAKWAFEKGKAAGAFYPAIVEYNRNTMASCSQNAIIFTNGDNDTYPMWYLQLMEKYRPDITVVNLSLLNTDWYISQLRDDYPYGNNNLECVKDLDLGSVKSGKWTATRIELPTHPLTGEKVSWTMNPTVDDKFIRTQDLMVVEILKRNNWKRPVYFSTTVYSINKIGLDSHLALEGLVLQVVPEKKEISPARLKSNLMEIYTYKGYDDPHFRYINELKPIYKNYAYAFRLLSTFYSDAGRDAEAKQIQKFMNRTLPADAGEI